VVAFLIARSAWAREVFGRRPGGVPVWQHIYVGVYVVLIVLFIAPSIEDKGFTWATLALALALTSLVVLLSGFWRWWNVFDPPRNEQRLAIGLAVVGGLVVLTFAFSVATAVLGAEGRLQDAGPDARASANLQDDLTVGSLSAYYVWHLLEAVPAAQIPKTLNWDAPYKFKDPWSGSLMFFYKLLVILPILAILKEFFSAKKAKAEGAEHASPT
jgi:hypothetical protein